MPGVPAEYVSLYDAAAATCHNIYITGAVLAAQGKAESGFRANADNGIAQGIAQFRPDTWKSWGNGGNVFDPKDAIPAQGRHMCALSKDGNVVKAAKKQSTGPLDEDKTPLPFILAAYNAGPGCVRASQGNCNDVRSWSWVGVPTGGGFKETQDYIHKIQDWAGVYDGMDPTFAAKVKALLEDPEAHNNLWMRYGFRSYAEQKALWDSALASTHGDVHAAKWLAANPDDTTSNHMKGIAADINGDRDLLHKLAPKYGLYFPLEDSPSHEWWHVEAIPQ